MSFWTKFRDWAITGKGELKYAEKFASKHIPHQHAADRRAANEATAAQIDLYKQQKEAMETESKRLQEEKDTTAKKNNEKQIKNLRRSYRAPGFMEEQQSGYSDTLG